MSKQYDAIVIGMGVVGTAAAYHLASAGAKVVALDQFDLDHRMGSSHGESRIIRYAYDHPIYVELVREAFGLWRMLEQESGKRLMVRTGGFDFGEESSESLLKTKKTLENAQIPFEWLDAREATQRFPQFKLNDSMRAIYQPDAAYLAASRCVLAQAELAHVKGAELISESAVVRIEPHGDSVEVITLDHNYVAKKLIIAAGAWTNNLLAPLGLNPPLRASREQVVYFEPYDRPMFAPDQCPVFIYHHSPWFYGLPNVDGAGVKVGIHCNGEYIDPNQVNRTPDEAYIVQVWEWARQFIPLAASGVKDARVCLYTMTPDEHFIFDVHPQHPNIIIGSPCSGHGFKFGNLSGKILADMALRGGTDYDISLFKINRFRS